MAGARVRAGQLPAGSRRLDGTGRVDAVLWLVFFLLYVATTVRDVLPADSGEFQLAAARWGVLHPPGYPLYTMVGALWVRLLPLGSLAFRLNLLSAALAATTLVLLAAATRTFAVRRLRLSQPAAVTGGVAAALLLGTAPTFWVQATTANIRMPTLLFCAWGFLALARYEAPRPAAQSSTFNVQLLTLALALGLGVGHHPSLVFLAVGWAVYLWAVDGRLLLRPREWLPAVGVAALAWLLPQLYIPLRGGMANVPLADPGLNTWSGFWQHVLAQGFSGDMFAYANATDLQLRLPLLPQLFALQFPPLLLVGTLLGWAVLQNLDAELAAPLLVSWLVHSFVTITYRAPQTVEYLMPAYLPIALTFGLSVALYTQYAIRHTRLASRIPHPVSRFTHHVSRLTFYVLLAFLCLRPFTFLGDFLKLAADRSIRERVAPLLEAAPPGALILADWHWATPLWVLQQVESVRPDVEVAYVYPQPPTDYDQVWRDRAEAAGDRPLFTTHSYEWPDWTFVPVGGGYRLYRRPLTELPAEPGFTPLVAELGTVRLLGYRLEGVLQPGRSVEVRLAWQATGTQEPSPSFTVRFFDPDGGLVAQADRFLGSDSAAGEVRFTQLTLQLPVDRCPAFLYPHVGVYTTQAGTFLNLGEVALPEQTPGCRFPTLPVVRFWPGVASGKGPFLRGVDYDVVYDQATAYLHWCGPGIALVVHSGETQRVVWPLGPGRCQTVALPVAATTRPQFTFTRLDGSPVQLLALPLPVPRPGERYLPFGDAAVLVGAERGQRAGQWVANLRWRVTTPWVDDYAVSVRPLRGDGSGLGAQHDSQPALSTLPTLKWVVHGARVLDSHPLAELSEPPALLSVAVYERFRLTPLPVASGATPVTFPLP